MRCALKANRWLLALTGAFLVGCGHAGTVTGTVTFENTPVADGWITLLPVDGAGPPQGSPIASGTYKVVGVQPGPKIVKIEAVKAVPFARTSEEMARMAADNKARGDATGIIDRADLIPPDAVGNNTTVEIRVGTQKLDFHLKKP